MHFMCYYSFQWDVIGLQQNVFKQKWRKCCCYLVSNNLFPVNTVVQFFFKWAVTSELFGHAGLSCLSSPDTNSVAACFHFSVSL